jgi:hypothetical protein
MSSPTHYTTYGTSAGVDLKSGYKSRKGFDTKTNRLTYRQLYSGMDLVGSFIVLMMEAVRTSEMSFYSETTRRYIPEDSNLQE